MKFLTAPLAFAFAVGLSGIALAMPDISPPQATTASVQQPSAPDQLTASTANPRLIGPDQRTASTAKPQLVGPDQRTASTANVQPEPVAAQPPSIPALPSDGGLSAFLIVLISVGGALALCAVAFAGVRVAHRHGHAAG